MVELELEVDLPDIQPEKGSSPPLPRFYKTKSMLVLSFKGIEIFILYDHFVFFIIILLFYPTKKSICKTFNKIMTYNKI